MEISRVWVGREHEERAQRAFSVQFVGCGLPDVPGRSGARVLGGR
jgi:hypothetical protein